MNTFCALNIIDSKGSLINKDNRPLMYIWDGKNELWEQIGKDESFKEYIVKELNIPDNFVNYINSTIVSFIYKKESTSESVYENKEISIQEMYPLEDNPNIGLYLLTFIMNHLYKLSFKEFPQKPENESYERYIYWLYQRIKDKYKEKLSNETIVQAVRNIIQTDKEFEGLNLDNQEYLIKQITNIIRDEI